jgi:hypothetical protein
VRTHCSTGKYGGKADMYGLIRTQIFILTVVLVFSSTYAFASSESGMHPGGEGVNTISGWNTSNVHYRLADDPTKISLVEFDLDGSAEMVKVSINSSDQTFFNCENSSGSHWICNITQERVSTANELRVIAFGN